MKLLLLLFFLTLKVHAIELVRDAEIEDYLREVSSPIFQSSNISGNSIQFYIVKDNSINAFVFGGQNIFVNTGLIESSNNPNMLQGVIAHEFGHIIGAHLLKSQPTIQKAIATYAIATLLGAGILASSQNNSSTNAAIATTMLGQHIAERQMLSFSRSQESEADRYALLFMQKSQIPSEGMLELFTKLESIQNKFTKEIDKYSTTHPLSSDRISYFKSHPFTGIKTPEDITRKHFFIQAKILAHSGNSTLYTNSHIILTHPEYKAYYLANQNLLEGKNKIALFHIENLLKIYPDNPYFHETIAIIYTNTKNYQKAKHHFQQAINISQNNFIMQEYATFLIKNFENKQEINEGIVILENLKNTKENSQIIYQNLQYAYSKLHLKEYYLIARIEEIALFGEKNNTENKIIIAHYTEELKQILQTKPNNIIMERLKRIQSLYEK